MKTRNGGEAISDVGRLGKNFNNCVKIELSVFQLHACCNIFLQKIGKLIGYEIDSP